MHNTGNSLDKGGKLGMILYVVIVAYGFAIYILQRNNMMNKMLLILTIMCCVGITYGVTVKFTDEGVTLTSDPIATGYAVDYDNYNGYVGDGVFDKFYGSRYWRTTSGARIWDDEDVRVGLPSWGEARGVIEFDIAQLPYSGDVYRDGQVETLYLDKIYLRRWWFSGSNAEGNASLYGYVGDGYMGANDVYETDILIASNIGHYGAIDVTDFVNSIKNNHRYAGFVLKENRNGVLLNYGSFYLDAYYIPEPSTIALLSLGSLILRKRK